MDLATSDAIASGTSAIISSYMFSALSLSRTRLIKTAIAFTIVQSTSSGSFPSREHCPGLPGTYSLNLTLYRMPCYGLAL
jgi:hypothetical protein